MTESSRHDELCPMPTWRAGAYPLAVHCECDLIARVRADERAAFADIPDTFRMLAVSTDHDVTCAAYLFAADLVASRIVRREGTP